MYKTSQNDRFNSNVEGGAFFGKIVQQLRVSLGGKALIFRTERNIDHNNLLG
ncbi:MULTISPECIES: hypothetical protein [unclassified Bartonella]|uniref:hypothetical protein n=1 Tax=unclassified Bartonella TaxID=2645622 RepID=UPI0035CF8FFC